MRTAIPLCECMMVKVQCVQESRCEICDKELRIRTENCRENCIMIMGESGARLNKITMTKARVQSTLYFVATILPGESSYS